MKHGEARHNGKRTPEYMAWKAMIARCHIPSMPNFKDYGGRGITVCDRWRHDYRQFLCDMGRRLSPKHTLGRIDNERGYEPDNCQWETRKQQAANTRRTVFVTINGKTQPLSHWAEELGIDRATVRGRIWRGMGAVEALLTPVKHERRRRRTA